MPTPIPKNVAESDLSRKLAKEKLIRVHQGKVRDTWTLPNHPGRLLQVATDRISIFDFVLNAKVPHKGEVLTAMTIFWLQEVLRGFRHHVEERGGFVDNYLPDTLCHNTDLQRRALVVKKLDMLPVEAIVRGTLTGSGFKSYQKDGTVCGFVLPEGLHDGDLIPDPMFPLFTPTTKAVEGHDEHMDATGVINRFGRPVCDLSRAAYLIAFTYAWERGVVIADTKFECSRDAFGDEIITPDSSRFWDRDEWEATRAKGVSPTPYDKQSVRDWGKAIATPFEGITGIGNLDPENPEHVAFVHDLEVPSDVLEVAARRYETIFRRIVGTELRGFQGVHMQASG
ncbi:MAG: phosphoribosylaminoimidazolesuccinocarboxamide synthase [Parcubacteria group bacterium]|nr:phosphoribosylaminoimidazolesuccinocarboxamide synthase [Parcubacteria group bacterium]